MSYRFVKISNFYPEYLADFRRRHPSTLAMSYENQVTALMSDAFGWADFHSRELRKRGVHATEIVANDSDLARAWVRENESVPPESDIVVEQISKLQPEVIFLQDPFRFNASWIARLKQFVPSVRLVLGWCAVPFTSEQLKRFSGLDAILTCAKDFVPQFQEAGLRAYHLHHAFEASLLERLGPRSNLVSDFVFLGSLMPGPGMHNLRIQILEKLVSESSFTIRVHGKYLGNSREKVFAQRVVYLTYQLASQMRMGRAVEKLFPVFRKAALWPETPRYYAVSKNLRSALRPPVYGIEMLRALQTSAIGFNSHIDSAEKFAANIRLFEVTGVGSCLVTDWKENIRELFEPDTEVVTYRTADECVEKVKWLIANPGKREEIALAGQRRCLRDHTYAKRVDELDRIIRQELSRKSLKG